MLAPHVADALRRSDHRIVITGAGGWLGMATLELLASVLGDPFPARVSCFGSRRRSLELLSGEVVEQRPLDEILRLPTAPTLVLHLAFLTKDRAEVLDEEQYRAANRALSRTVLDALEALGAEGIFVPSSGAAALADNPRSSPAMRLYGSLKREDEGAFSAWAANRTMTAVIARIHNLAGPHISTEKDYALASFIGAALGGGPIVVRAPHDVVRAYVAIRELMSLVFALLLWAPGKVHRFDSGGEPMEVGDIAAEVAAYFDGCPIERAQRSGAPADIYVGDAEIYRSLLREFAIEEVPFRAQVAETAEFISGCGGHFAVNEVTRHA